MQKIQTIIVDVAKFPLKFSMGIRGNQFRQKICSFRRRRKDSKVQSFRMHFEKRESLLRKILLFLIEFAHHVPQKYEKLVKDLALL